MKDYERAADALRVALSLNPNFPEAHRRLAMILRRRLNDEEGAREHERLHRETRMRAGPKAARPVAKSFKRSRRSGVSDRFSPRRNSIRA